MRTPDRRVPPMYSLLTDLLSLGLLDTLSSWIDVVAWED